MLWGLLHPQTNQFNDPTYVTAIRFQNTHSGDDLRRRSQQRWPRISPTSPGLVLPRTATGTRPKPKDFALGDSSHPRAATPTTSSRGTAEPPRPPEHRAR